MRHVVGLFLTSGLVIGLGGESKAQLASVVAMASTGQMGTPAGFSYGYPNFSSYGTTGPGYSGYSSGLLGAGSGGYTAGRYLTASSYPVYGTYTPSYGSGYTSNYRSGIYSGPGGFKIGRAHV